MLEVDKHFRLISPNLHDGNLVGLRYDDAGITVDFQGDDNLLMSLRLDGVDRFYGSDLREGNIVSDVYIYETAEDMPEDILQKAFFGSCKPSPNFDLCKSAQGLSGLNVVSSYGIEICALASRITQV